MVHNKILFNENYFETIDTEHKAYFLGFIYADGCIHIERPANRTKPSYVFRIGLNVKDRETIVKLAEELNYPIEKISLVKSTNSNALRIRNQKLFDDLYKQGVRPNKTVVGVEIPNLPNELIGHFIRGYFDGDGCYSSKTMSILGHQNLLEWINAQIGNTANIYDMSKFKGKNNGTAGNYFRLQSAKKSTVKSLYDLMYNNATIFLKRKLDKFQ